MYCDHYLGNSIVDPLTQKAFFKGINGCIKHTQHKLCTTQVMYNTSCGQHKLCTTQVMYKFLTHTHNKKIVIITCFDLADAFSSEDHPLIIYNLDRNYLPPVPIEYGKNMYGQIQGYVQGQTLESQPFNFRHGVFQGYPCSSIYINF